MVAICFLSIIDSDVANDPPFSRKDGCSSRVCWAFWPWEAFISNLGLNSIYVEERKKRAIVSLSFFAIPPVCLSCLCCSAHCSSAPDRNWNCSLCRKQLGLERRRVFLLLLLCLLGSYVNIPIVRLPPERVESGQIVTVSEFLILFRLSVNGRVLFWQSM